MRTFITAVVIVLFACSCSANFVISNAEIIKRSSFGSGVVAHSMLYLGSVILLIVGAVGVYNQATKPRSISSTFLFVLSNLAVSNAIFIFCFSRVIFEALIARVYQTSPWLFYTGVILGLAWFVGSLAYWSNQPKRAKAEYEYEGVYAYSPPYISTSNQLPINANKLKVGADGELVSVAQTSEQGDIALQGFGNQATQTVYLEFGRYQLEYNFTSDQPCEITLVSVDDLESANALILNQSGTGSKTFAVQSSGRYVFEVRCPFANVRWDFCCRLL